MKGIEPLLVSRLFTKQLLFRLSDIGLGKV